MRGFSTPPFRDVTFTHGGESVTYRVYARPLMFDTLMGIAYAAPDDSDPEAGRYWEHVVVLHIAASLRDEDLPPMPAWDAPRETWAAHAQQLNALYQQAGLSNGEIAVLNVTSREMTVSKGLTEALEQAGNA